MENTEDRAGATSEQQDNVINTVNSLDPYGPSWQLVPGNVAAGTVYAQVPTSGTGDLTFTRASTATRTNSAGNIVDVATGVGRIHYRNADGSLSSTGRLLLEPQRTNGIRNSTMVGAVAGSPGTLPTNWARVNGAGLTQTVVGIGTENGLPYIDFRFDGIATGTVIIFSLDTTTGIPAATGQTWTYALYAKTISGTVPSPRLSITERTAAGTSVIDGNSGYSPTSTLGRFSFTRTLSGGATVGIVQPGLYFFVTIGEAYDFTIRIAAPQMELGATATTFIPTTTASVTRLVDAFSRNNLFTNNIVTASGGTWFLDLSGNLSIPRDTSTGIFIGDSATNNTGNQIIIRNGSSSGSARVSVFKYISGTATAIYTTTSDNLKLAIKWNGSVVEVFQNGVKVVSSSVFTTTNMQNLVGNGGGTPFFINQSSLFPVPLTDAECIEITTL